MPARACRECGGAVHNRATRALCPSCHDRFCYKCDVPLPEGKLFALCSDCTRQKREGTLARKGRLCYMCQQRPPTPRSQVCSQCHHGQYIETRKILLPMARKCQTCGARMPKGRMAYHCGACVKEQRLAYNQGKVCARCKKRQRYRDRSYCKLCWLSLGNLWRAARRGDPLVSLIIRPKPRLSWQEKR